MNRYEEVLAYLSPVWVSYTQIVSEKAEGCWVYDISGEKYLDFTCGIGVTNTGHCHPVVVRAIQEQAAKLIHAQMNIVKHKPIIELIEELRTIVPEPIDCFFFTNSGAEAIEGAIKLARHATKRTNLIVFQGSFHGRTVGTMALTTSKTVYRVGYQPLMPGVFVAPYPYAYRYGWDEEETSRWCLGELEFLLHSQTAPEETAAILIEPVLGEGGYVVPPKSFMQGLRRICDEYEILLICDEIQAGFGRTGKWFSFQHFDIIPDIVTVAKGLASGMPLAGVFSRRELMEKWVPGSHGGTYGGNAVAAAAAVATIRVMKEENLLENAIERGAQLKRGLQHLQEEFPVIGDVRGLGLMIGSEFRTAERKPDKKTAKDVVHACLDRKLMLLTCGTWDNTIRWIPPLIVTQAEIDLALSIFYDALREVVGKN
ncbi:MAG: aminotransferase class III-fold pyridoxal phosphate-dependent enzyme [Anaerolineales bacterium]|nr:aminotransferase class III-fold pyridoxal phosphate-dependent enzyme [Anaerolineales bacterium]MDW8160962.1 aminotransferase class III-fold pyridoxal phosphate-dependent enzyme [Anaerolineales bacterium]